MKKYIFLFFLTAVIFTTSYAQEPRNLDIIKASLVKYHDSGEYQKDQARVIHQAMQYLKIRLEKAHRAKTNKKLALVLDIDETSLSNYPAMLARRFGGSNKEIEVAINNANAPAVEATLELYRYAKANHVAVFFVTGRTGIFQEATVKNLKYAGYSEWDGLELKAENYTDRSTAPYKINSRLAIEKQGYDIVLNIGDQQSDLYGGHADKAFKLPNPYYFIP